MQILIGIGVVALGYVLGSIPFGLLIVKIKTGKDIREVESGRTGGTNALRAAGLGAGLLTVFLDILKAASAAWIAQVVLPDYHSVHVMSAIAAILGHNYSIFLSERDANGRFRLRGGAGGAPSVGGAMGLWWPSILIILPLGVVAFFTIGIASIVTLAVAVFATIIFGIRAFLGHSSAWDVVYGIVATALLAWALRPNLQKLAAGKERVVGISLHGVIKKKREQKNTV